MKLQSDLNDKERKIIVKLRTNGNGVAVNLSTLLPKGFNKIKKWGIAYDSNANIDTVNQIYFTKALMIDAKEWYPVNFPLRQFVVGNNVAPDNRYVCEDLIIPCESTITATITPNVAGGAPITNVDLYFIFFLENCEINNA